jgi:curved DNA-binding protein CbpA
MATVRDLYEILGVGRDASTEDIRTAYRRLAREFHPDVSADPEAEQRFRRWRRVRDPLGRRQAGSL